MWGLKDDLKSGLKETVCDFLKKYLRNLKRAHDAK